MPQMLSLRTFRLSSTTGHVVMFQAGTPIDVPDCLVSEAMAAGCVPTDQTTIPFYENLSRATVEFQGDARKSTIFLAIKSICEENDNKNFDAGGTPKSDVIGDRLGYTVARDEVRDIFQQYMTTKQDGAEFALHPQAQNIMRVIEATTKGELLELSKEFAIPEEKSKGLSVRDLRRLLLVTFNGTPAG